MIFTFRFRMTTTPIESDGSWHPIINGVGVRLWDNGDGTFALRISNGAVGQRGEVGGLFFDEMSLECPGAPVMYPRVGHSITGNTIRIGSGAEYFPPRAIKIVRFAIGVAVERIYEGDPLVSKHAHLALPNVLAFEQANYDRLADDMLRALETGATIPNMIAACGIWHPYGEFQAGAPGGAGIEPFPGWERSKKYRLVAHDLTMERHAVEYVDVETGTPIYHTDQDYRLSRGWGKVTQLDTFREAIDPTNRWNENGRPYDVNARECAYLGALCGYVHTASDGWKSWQGGYQPIDGQHLVRATRHAKAAAFMWGDQCAEFDLKMIACDGFMGTHSGTPPDGRGADMGRSYAWVLDALLAAGMNRHALQLVTAANRAQTPSGAWWYAAPENEAASGFNPSPWKDLHLARDQFATHTLETAYMASSMSLANQDRQAQAAMLPLLRLPSHATQWIGLRPDLTTYGDGVGNAESFQMWPTMGRLATVNPSARREFAKMLPPGGSSLCGANVKDAMLNAGNYEASAKALESLEL